MLFNDIMGSYKLYRTIKRSNIYQNVNFYSSNPLKRNVALYPNNKSEKKVTVVKRSYPADSKNSPIALETKEASSVIKRLNWEFKHLYGPLLQPKTEPGKTKEVCTLNRDTSYRTENLIAKPDPNLESSQCGLSMVPDFPLMNQPSPLGTESVFVSKVNSLREDLLLRCNSKPPSVSRILEKTMPKESAERLRLWKLRMIEELGEEGFKAYHQALLDRGSSLHSSINSYLSSPQEEVLVDESNEGHWKSLNAVFPQIKNVRLLEERISHPFLCYQGIVDCFAEYKDHLVVVDWKTSKKPKTSLYKTYDNPLQIAAYVGALNYDSRLQYLVNKGLIVVAYESGAPATQLFIDENRMLRYWTEWLKRVKQYWEMVEKEKNEN